MCDAVRGRPDLPMSWLLHLVNAMGLRQTRTLQRRTSLLQGIPLMSSLNARPKTRVRFLQAAFSHRLQSLKALGGESVDSTIPIARPLKYNFERSWFSYVPL